MYCLRDNRDKDIEKMLFFLLSVFSMTSIFNDFNFNFVPFLLYYKRENETRIFDEQLYWLFVMNVRRHYSDSP